MASTEELRNEEFKLAQEMKEQYCDESGREKDPRKAANTIYEIGLLYRKRSPDKISLIKSVGLFNAAIVRNPSTDFKDSLSETCQHILQQAKAKSPDEDLIKKAEQVKEMINKLRTDVKEVLQHSVPKITTKAKKHEARKLMLKKVSAIKQINKEIAYKYKNIMVDLSRYCENVLGKPPCKYAIVAMGSLAREEITPYSDFEHIILLCDHSDDTNHETHLEYFRWFSVIFHTIILNVQETIIPSLNINSLNDKDSELTDWFYDKITPNGISFDGMMPHACKFPLGRQQHTKTKQFTTELIKPVTEMLDYLSFEANLKNGYHLAEILTKTCFVHGNENIHEQFVKGAECYRNSKSKTEIISNITKEVKEDLNSFSTRFRLTGLKSQNTINIKRLVYRSTTLFIAALAKIYNISSNSCFDIIDEMAKGNKITSKTANKLECAIAIACEIRLRIYITEKSQCDDINLQEDGAIEKFLNIVGVKNTVSYFQISYCLQCEVAKQLNFTKLHFYSDPYLINITIGLAFGIKILLKLIKKPQRHFWDLSSFNFDNCMAELETKTYLDFDLSENLKRSLNQTSLSAEQIEFIAENLMQAKVSDEALDFFKQLLNIYECKSTEKVNARKIAWVNDQIGVCLYKLRKPMDGLEYLQKALEIQQDITNDPKTDNQIANIFHNIAECCVDLQHFNDALKYLYKALAIKQSTTLNSEKDRTIATTLHTIGYCNNKLHNYDKAVKTLNQALAIRQKTTYNADKDKSIATTLHEIGYAYIYLQDYDRARRILNQSLKIEQITTRNAERDKSIAVKFHSIGLLEIELREYQMALTYFNKELDIRRNATLDADKDKSIATALYEVGCCNIELHNYERALTNFNQVLKIRQNTKLHAENDSDIEATRHKINLCNSHLHSCNNAFKSCT